MKLRNKTNINKKELFIGGIEFRLSIIGGANYVCYVGEGREGEVPLFYTGWFVTEIEFMKEGVVS